MIVEPCQSNSIKKSYLSETNYPARTFTDRMDYENTL